MCMSAVDLAAVSSSRLTDTAATTTATAVSELRDQCEGQLTDDDKNTVQHSATTSQSVFHLHSIDL